MGVGMDLPFSLLLEFFTGRGRKGREESKPSAAPSLQHPIWDSIDKKELASPSSQMSNPGKDSDWPDLGHRPVP